MTDQRSELVRVTIPMGRPGVDGTMTHSGAEIRALTAPRVDEYKARRHDREYRERHGLDVARTSGTNALRGNEPAATLARQVAAAHNRTGLARALPRFVPRVVVALLDTSPAEGWIAIGVAGLLLGCICAGLIWELEWRRTAGVVLALGITVFFTSALAAAAGLGERDGGRGRTDR